MKGVEAAAAAYNFTTISSQSPRHLKRLQALHDKKRIRIRDEKQELLDIGLYDEAFLESQMRRTN